jgi:hypothetical protein
VTISYCLRIVWFLDFVHRPEFQIIENTTFRKIDLFPFSGEGSETPALLGLLERDNLNHWTLLMDLTEHVSPCLHLRTETDTVSEILCFLIV